MPDWLQVALRLLHFAALLGLFGLTAFPLLGRGAITWSSKTGGTDKAVVFVAILAPLLTIALMLSSIAAMMGQTLAALEWATVEVLVRSTDMGTAFLIRTASLCVAMIALVSGHQTRPKTFIAAICYALALITLGWSGHAATTEGPPGLFHRLNNAVHLLGAGLWIGAILSFLRLTLAAHRNPLPTPPAPGFMPCTSLRRWACSWSAWSPQPGS